MGNDRPGKLCFEKYQYRDRDIELICSEYRLGEPTIIHRDIGGGFNANVKVETLTGIYVIRFLSKCTTSEHISYENEVLKMLKRSGVPVVIPLRNRRGRSTSKLHGHFVQVTPFIDAIAFDVSPEQVWSSGHTFRRFHKILEGFKDGPVPLWSHYPSKRILRTGLSRLQELQDELSLERLSEVRRIYEVIRHGWKKGTYRNPLSTTIIHGDWHFWNQLYTEDGDVCCVLDLDFIQRAERVQDLGYTLWNIFAIFSTDSGVDICHNFLNGYGKLPRDEVKMLPLAVAKSALFFICSTAFRKNVVSKFNFHFDRQLPIIEWMLSSEGQDTIEEMCTTE
ncbi:phosphotransferase enzyme family protein [Alicyclobacillus dauci]|uniref:Phosphotransferase n=1 Tax=Alicyclobacillus dauci TaxID=1475485 RepID=A0ABY6ZB63_9BACL|nr:phosphotransferase [Alicyclobacillus dauci]WAH39335.1 phosphotransferase [Alicyclobacillus dauci]